MALDRLGDLPLVPSRHDHRLCVVERELQPAQELDRWGPQRRLRRGDRCRRERPRSQLERLVREDLTLPELCREGLDLTDRATDERQGADQDSLWLYVGSKIDAGVHRLEVSAQRACPLRDRSTLLRRELPQDPVEGDVEGGDLVSCPLRVAEPLAVHPVGEVTVVVHVEALG